MEIGIHYSRFPDSQGSIATTLAETARLADDGGVELLTLMDHWWQMEVWGGRDAPMLEGYSGLAYVAALTRRLRLGLLVTGVTYRHPGLLAKTVTTLDVLSEGRAQLGLGAAWYEEEHVGLGVPFPPLKERFERLEETLQICRRMLDGERGAFEGNHYRLADTANVPPPVQPHLPIMVGGAGERKTLRLVARYADACNLFASSGDDVRHKLDVLRRHCDDVGRDYDEIRKTAMAPHDVSPVDEPDRFLRTAEEFAAEGIDLVTVSHDGVDPVRWTATVVDKVLPRLRDL